VDNTYLVAALWVSLALAASLLSIRLGLSVALTEIILGVAAGNTVGLHSTPWIDFLAGFGAVLLTFLAGAEIDPDSLRRQLKPSLAIGAVGFAAPAVVCFLIARFVLGWSLPAAEIAGIALSTTSVAVVYAVMIESGLAATEIGKLILAACFINDLGTVVALGLIFADVSPLLVLFIAVMLGVVAVLPRFYRWFVGLFPGRVSEPEIKVLFLVLFFLGGLASAAQSEAVLPAYLVGLAAAGVLAGDRVLVHRLRATAFSLLTPFYFLKAGSYVSLPALVGGVGLVGLFFAGKVAAKLVGVWPTSRALALPPREASYTTLMMSTGLTFGTISALYGLTHGYVDQQGYTVLVTVVILTAIVPTMVATTFFEPRVASELEAEEVEAAEEIDAGPLPHPHPGAPHSLPPQGAGAGVPAELGRFGAEEEPVG
jgi:Kef-type K+ transport system membrane component KefB